MLKPDCPCSCEVPLTREISVLGTPLRVKNYVCARDGGACRPKPEQVQLQLSVVLTRACNARCPFCIAGPSENTSRLDPDRFRKVLEQLKQENVLRGIKITGGEPGLDLPLLESVLQAIFELFPPEMEVSLDTNGTLLPGLAGLRDLYRLESVHISRHHWDDAVNDGIFCRSMPSAETLHGVLKEIACPDLFVLNCLMLRGIISTPEDVHRYLDFAIDMGAGKAAFITADPVNAWTAARRVSYEEVLREDDPSLLFTRGYRDYSWCRCQDGVYVSPSGRLIEFYGRQTEERGCDYCRGLVYGPDNLLRSGFGDTGRDTGTVLLSC